MSSTNMAATEWVGIYYFLLAGPVDATRQRWSATYCRLFFYISRHFSRCFVEMELLPESESVRKINECR